MREPMPHQRAQNPSRPFSTKSGKGKSKQKAKQAPKPYAPLSAKSPSSLHSPPKTPPKSQAQSQASVPPIRRDLFPNYSASPSTPLPPPSMPRKPFLRRALPILFAATGAYVLLRTPKKESSKTNDEVITETSVPTAGKVC